MLRKCFSALFLSLSFTTACFAQYPATVFEQSKGLHSATYQQCIDFYKSLDSASNKVLMDVAGPTDAGHNLNVVIYNPSGERADMFKDKIRVLINNSIHPGEPDGMDACMMLMRDAALGKIKIPDNIVLVVIPVYNIGGALNRNQTSRVNQDGPESYGFRGNAQNLDLNRDFTKNDSYEALSFASIFHFAKPTIFIDNHVSDGADYQHVLTLLSTQYDKLGGALGQTMRTNLDPAIYKAIKAKGWPMIPYVNFEDGNPKKGWKTFYDPPRYASGYTALFHTIGYTIETHMLKPFKQRVLSTYDLMNVIVNEASKQAIALERAKAQDLQEERKTNSMPLSWQVDTTRSTNYTFMGYEAKYKASEVTGAQRLYYDRKAPFTTAVPIYDYYLPKNFVAVPKAYIIPQGWHSVIDRLKKQGVLMDQLQSDVGMTVSAYIIEDYKSLTKPYEGHYKHYDVTTSTIKTKVNFHQGDYYIPTNQPGRRFIVEMLEPTGDDSYFAWNFFDAVLQQKEGYSDYRWEDIAADYLAKNPTLRQALEAKKSEDPDFAKNPSAQLRFVYTNSPWYEPEHRRYPVFRVEQ